jgi:hypothetical protein
VGRRRLGREWDGGGGVLKGWFFHEEGFAFVMGSSVGVIWMGGDAKASTRYEVMSALHTRISRHGLEDRNNIDMLSTCHLVTTSILRSCPIWSGPS